jgi:outer membrane protein assembly factor BamA/autotransporter translocation and assembly factor TamB
MSPTGPEQGPSIAGTSGPGTPGKGRRWLKRLLVPAAAALALASMVHAPFVRDRVRQYVVTAARDRLDTALSIGVFDYNLLTLTFHATDVTAAATRSAVSPFFRADEVTVRLRPGVLLGRVGFSSIELVRPGLALTRDADGRYRLPRLRSTDGSTRAVAIDRLSIAGLDLQIEGAPPTTVEARDVSVRLEPAGGHIAGRLLAVDGVRFRTPGGEVVGIGLDGTVGLSPDAVLIGPLTATMPDSRVILEGRVPFAPGPSRIDLSYRGSVSLAAAARLWPALGVSRGQVSATGRLSGPFSDLSLTFDAASASPVVRGIPLSRLAAQGRFGHGAVALSSVSVDVAAGRITGTATIGLDDAVRSAASVRWRRVGLGGLLRALDVAAPFPLAAQVDGEAAFTWDGRGLPSLAVNASAQASRVAAPGAVPFGGRASLKVAGAHWVLDAEHTFGEVTTISGQLSGQLNESHLAATTLRGHLGASLGAADLARMAALAPTVAPSLRARAGRVNGDVTTSLDLSGTLNDPQLVGTVDAEALHVEGFGAGRLHAALRVDRRSADIETLSATLRDADLHATGVVPFDGRPADLELSGSVRDVAAWLDAVPARWRPSGTVSVNGRLTGPVSAPRLDGAVSSASLAWPSWTSGAIDGDVRLADGRVQFTTRVPDLCGTVSGSFTLSSPFELDVTARVEQGDLQRLGELAIGLGAPRLALTGTATASARVTGAAGSDRPMVLDARVEALQGTVDGHALRLVAPARLVASSARVAADQLQLEIGRSTVAVAGSVPAAAGERALRIDAVAELAEWWPPAAGRLRATIEVTGSPRRPALAGEASLSAASVTWEGIPPLTGIAAKARLANDAIELVEAGAGWSGAAIVAHGRLPLALLPGLRDFARDYGVELPDRQRGRDFLTSFELRAAVTSLTEKALEPWLGARRVEQVHGRVDAELTLQGASLAVEDLRGTAVITQSDTTLGALTLGQPKPARVTIERGLVQVAEATWAVGNRGMTLGGSVDIRGGRPRLDLTVNGDVDLALGRLYLPVALSGRATIDARITGDARNPSVAGSATLANVGLSIADPRVAVSGLSGRVTFGQQRLVVDARGNLNGGDLEVTGTLPILPLASGETPPAGLRARGRSFLVEWPEGLRSSLDADVTYRVDAQGGILTGRVDVEPGTYRRVTPPKLSTSPGAGAAEHSLVDDIRLDLSVATRSPGLMDNSYARLEMEASVHVGGTVGQPGIAGHLLARENGEVFLRGNVFKINRGSLEFKPDPRSSPSLDLLAETRRSGYDIRLRMNGPLDDLHVVLTSDPPLAQPDLVSLVTTGSTSNSMSPGATTGQGQDALVSAISSDILGLAGKTVGLDSVRVGQLELDLMGDDVDPQTRLTIGKAVGAWLDLLLSQNLRESGLTWAVTVHPRGSVDVRFISRDAKSQSVEVRHEIIFGQPASRGSAPTPPKTRKTGKALPRVASVTVSGGGLAEREVLDVTKVRTGDHFEFVEWQRDRERVERLFHSRGYLQVQVSATREPVSATDTSVALRYQVRRGSLSTLRVTGFTLPDRVIGEMKTAWARSVDDGFLEEQLRDRARGAMIDLGYLWPEITATVASTEEPREKTADVRITPGPRASRRTLVFTGRTAVPARDLRNELERSGSAAKAWREPAAVAATLEQFYRRKGFLTVTVTAAPPVFDGSTARLPITIAEGPQYVVSRIEVRGAGATPLATVYRWLGWRVGDPFDPTGQEAAARRIESGYAADGYRDARVVVAGVPMPGGSEVAVLATVQPGVRSVVGEVQVIGRGKTREVIVRHAIDLPVGSAASASTADRAQRRLYETEAFRSVDVQLVPMTDVPAAPAASTGAGAAPPEQLTRVVVRLEEAPLYRLRYGVSLTDDLTVATQISDLRPGVSAELRRRNLFGTALGGAIGGRYEIDNWSVRGGLDIPSSVLWGALSSLYFKQSLSTDQGETGPIKTYETSLTYQDRWRIGQKSELSYGYTLTREQLRFGTEETGIVDAAPNRRGNLFAAVAWDRRDSVFNATRGFLHSSSVEYGAPILASDFSYFRYVFQQTYYRMVGGLVLAGAARIGLLTDVNATEDQTYTLRFRTGGAQTVRGYDQESLTASDHGLGGRAMLVLNAELRFPVWRWVKGVAFLDAGNAFVDPSHISLGDLKVGTGLGLRLDTPYALFRLDIGFPVPQQSNTLIRRWYFSIGQMF